MPLRFVEYFLGIVGKLFGLGGLQFVRLLIGVVRFLLGVIGFFLGLGGFLVGLVEFLFQLRRFGCQCLRVLLGGHELLLGIVRADLAIFHAASARSRSCAGPGTT